MAAAASHRAEDTAIEILGLTKRFGDFQPVTELSLEIRAGETFGLLGPNGAGKTTTLSMIATLLEPSGGDARILGHSIRSDVDTVRRLVGLAPQQISLYPKLSAQENMQFFGRLYGLKGAPLRQRIDELLESVGLAGRRDDRSGTFSGGMQRRLNLACALVHDPQVVLLDEPTAGVDPQSRELLFELIGSIAEAGKTIVYTSHYIEEVERLCDRIAIIDHGKVIAQGTRHELLAIVGLGEVMEVTAPELDERAIEALPGFRGFEQQGDRYRIFVDDASAALIGFSRLMENAEKARDLEIYPVNLERVFIHLTGRELRD